MYTTALPKIVNGIVSPTNNVATIEMSALVVNGVSRTRNALLNGDYINYDWDSGYTCHQLGSGDILVRLGKFALKFLIIFNIATYIHIYIN